MEEMEVVEVDDVEVEEMEVEEVEVKQAIRVETWSSLCSKVSCSLVSVSAPEFLVCTIASI